MKANFLMGAVPSLMVFALMTTVGLVPSQSALADDSGTPAALPSHDSAAAVVVVQTQTGVAAQASASGAVPIETITKKDTINGRNFTSQVKGVVGAGVIQVQSSDSPTASVGVPVAHAEVGIQIKKQDADTSEFTPGDFLHTSSAKLIFDRNLALDRYWNTAASIGIGQESYWHTMLGEVRGADSLR